MVVIDIVQAMKDVSCSLNKLFASVEPGSFLRLLLKQWCMHRWVGWGLRRWDVNFNAHLHLLCVAQASQGGGIVFGRDVNVHDSHALRRTRFTWGGWSGG